MGDAGVVRDECGARAAARFGYLSNAASAEPDSPSPVEKRTAPHSTTLSTRGA